MADTDTEHTTAADVFTDDPEKSDTDETDTTVDRENGDATEEPAEDVHPPDTPEEVNPADTPHKEGDDDQGDESETFSRTYVESLRRENAKYRERAQRGDTYAHRLHTELVRATGRLADPTDMAFDENHLDDPDALTTALDELLARKPHLASRRPSGDIGQGATPSAAPVDLAGMLRQRA